MFPPARRPPPLRWAYDGAAEAFKITALTDIEAGAEVFDSYGKKCNSRFLLNYGFAVADNRDADGRCHNELRHRWFDADALHPV